MLLVLDVGNTNTVLGVFEERPEGSDSSKPRRLIANWRVTTNKSQTVDEYGVLFRNLFAMNKIAVSATTGIVISSVVPPLDSTLREVSEPRANIWAVSLLPGSASRLTRCSSAPHVCRGWIYGSPRV
jgi:type III pantothenate kinase